MTETRIVKSTCGFCLAACGVLITLKDGKAVELRGDPENILNKGDLCQVGLASLEYLYSPERLTHPLRRMGQRAEGKWQQISWDEALSQMADKLNQLRKNYGPESVAIINGSAKGYQDTHLRRFGNAFGTPNVACSDYVCHFPRMLAAEITMGFFPESDYGYPPASLIIWGTNTVNSLFYAYKNWLQVLDRGTRLVVIDPLEIEIAQKADLWLQVRPGSDLALALGMINVIINEGLIDKAFVDNWTTGFDKLKKHVQDYTPEKVARITWIDAETICKAARFYATNKPGIIDWGNGTDHNLNSFQTGRALSILMAITGNIGVPGGEIETAGSGFRRGDTESSETGMLGYWSAQLELRDKLPADKWQNRVGADLNLLRDYRYVLPQSIVKAITEGDPYPIRAAYVQACNPLSCWSNIQEAYRALGKLDFLAVSDMFMTPTAALADIVLPSACYLEYDGIVMPPNSSLAQVQRKVVQIGECRSDHEILNELARKLGLYQYFWDSVDGFWDAILEPIGLNFDEFQRVGQISGIRQYRKYQRNGFKTPSGKVELYSSHLEKQGLDPLPVYYELPETPYSVPERAKEYPLLFTSRKTGTYRDSSGRQLPSLRNSHPDPLITIHPETARKLDIKDGDWVYIETRRGRIRNKASLSTGVDPRVVALEHGWWFPEKGQAELFGWAESNTNVLTDDKPPFSREIGSAHLKGIACKVYKAF